MACGADRYPFWAANFRHLPTLSTTGGTAPLTVQAAWPDGFAVLADPAAWADYPWYEHILVDWGDGTVLRVPTSEIGVAEAQAGVMRKTWPAQSVAHTYTAAGSYTVRLLYEKPGIVDGDVLATVTVEAPPPPPPPPPPVPVLVAINAGGGGYAASDGTVYQEDRNFSGKSRSYGTRAAIAGTEDDALYRRERYGTGPVLAYDLPLPDGTYDVTLKLAENYFSAAGRRRFDVVVEGLLVADDLDLFATAGGRYIAWDLARRVQVTDGNLDIDLVKVLDNPKVNAILVRTADPATPEPQSGRPDLIAAATAEATALAALGPAALAAASGAEPAAGPAAGGDAAATAATTTVYDIRYLAFLPANHLALDDPAARCRSADGTPRRLVQAGDDRGFAEDPATERRYRVMQRAVIVRTTLPDGSVSFALKRTESRARPTLAFVGSGGGRGSVFGHGDRQRIDATDHDARLGDCRLLHAETASDRRLRRDPWLIAGSAAGAVIGLRGAYRLGQHGTARPELDWDLRVTLDASGDRPRISVRGRHDRVAAHELYVDGRPLFRRSPLGGTPLPVLALPVPSLPVPASPVASLPPDPGRAAGRLAPVAAALALGQ